MPFWADPCGLKELYVLDEGQDRSNPFAAARGGKSSMRPFAKLLWTLVYIAVGTDNLDNAFEGTTFGIGDWVLAFYSTIYSYYGW